MMHNNYDNWERLVKAVLLRDELRRLALCPSMESSSSIYSRSLNSSINESVFYEQNIGFGDYEENSRPESVQSFFLDEKTGKKCFMVGVRELKISHGDISQFWKWTSHSNSSFSKVAELQSFWRLDIRGNIKTKMLHPFTIYAAYLLFKISGNYFDAPELAKAMIRFVNDESDKSAEKRAQIVHLRPGLNGHFSVKRDDGWTEVKIGNFFVGPEEDGEVEARLLEIKKWKSGVIIEGILFRPTDVYIEAPIVSKQYMLRNAWG